MKRQIIAGLAAAPLALGLAIAGAPSAHAATLGITATSDGKIATVTVTGCDPTAQGNDKAVEIYGEMFYADKTGGGAGGPVQKPVDVTTYQLPTGSKAPLTVTYTCTYYGGAQQTKSIEIGPGYVAGVTTLDQVPTAGAVVTLFDAKGNQVGSATSDANGKVNFGPLADGQYYAKVVFPNGDVKYYKISVAVGIESDWTQVDSIPTPANPAPAPANPGNSGAPGLSNTGGSDAE